MTTNPYGIRHRQARAWERADVLATPNRSRNADQAPGIIGFAPTAPGVSEFEF